MTIAGKEPCFFGWLISSDSPKKKKKRKFNDKHLSIAFSYKFKLFILNNMPINLELQHPPIWSWAFDCHPSPEDGKFEPCLGIFEPTE